jgi:hypothetical protein
MTDERERPVPVPPPGEGPGAAGQTRLDDALARLDGLDDLATAHHARALESVHEALVAELARTED